MELDLKNSSETLESMHKKVNGTYQLLVRLLERIEAKVEEKSKKKALLLRYQQMLEFPKLVAHMEYTLQHLHQDVNPFSKQFQTSRRARHLRRHSQFQQVDDSSKVQSGGSQSRSESLKSNDITKEKQKKSSQTDKDYDFGEDYHYDSNDDNDYEYDDDNDDDNNDNDNNNKNENDDKEKEEKTQSKLKKNKKLLHKELDKELRNAEKWLEILDIPKWQENENEKEKETLSEWQTKMTQFIVNGKERQSYVLLLKSSRLERVAAMLARAMAICQQPDLIIGL
ncbi:hypothetical protein RFI_23250 [Reticulomyxa filosa]|uniref:Uncharacterized protein n=1 Tax=Reticulomyxa filosa TaxID=46433 RepID=X6MJC6_RETFI|nr:hypothetical protein RFI_23250 [Reticulomyxa filosa]|eukprot:ETO14118.1 hypothetical protein RFI_23250 [Reticulomyxa filosa]